jgi:hypothetical protein
MALRHSALTTANDVEPSLDANSNRTQRTAYCSATTVPAKAPPRSHRLRPKGLIMHMRGQPNELLKQAILATGRTYEGLASAVRRAAVENGEILRTNKSAVAHRINRAQPAGQVRHYIAEALSRRTGRTITLADLGFASPEESLAASTDPMVRVVGGRSFCDFLVEEGIRDRNPVRRGQSSLRGARPRPGRGAAGGEGTVDSQTSTLGSRSCAWWRWSRCATG